MWSSSTIRFVNIARQIDRAMWVNVGEVEAVLDRGQGNSVVRMRSGSEYATSHTVKEVLGVLFKEAK